jgi:hypothetical protein
MYDWMKSGVLFGALRTQKRLGNVLGAASVLALLSVAGCAGQGPEAEPGAEEGKTVVVAPEQQGIIEFDQLSPALTSGTYQYRGVTLHFESETREAGHEVTLQLRGMVLTATIDASGVFDLDGFDTATGEDTNMTEVDSTVIHTFEVALTDLYRARGQELRSLDTLNRAVTIWGDYSPSLPLRRTFYGRSEHAVLQDLCGRVNRTGQGAFSPRWTWGSHDCLKIKNFWGDCGAVSAGCLYGDDSSSVENVFLSMHPSGSCSDSSYFGSNSSNFRCYEPDHEANTEFLYGACPGRCGGSCGGGTQFTQACLDHDICVRFGHLLASPECDDDLVDATFDAIWASNCSNVAFQVNYNWAGSPSEGACPTSYRNSNDGCDVGCQFVDGDCFR